MLHTWVGWGRRAKGKREREKERDAIQNSLEVTSLIDFVLRGPSGNVALKRTGRKVEHNGVDFFGKYQRLKMFI